MIDEKKLIEELRKKAKEYDEDCGYWNKRGECANGLICAGKCTGIVRAIKMIEQQPKVGEWIPCSERLPKEPKTNPVLEGKNLELYLVTTEHGSNEQDKAYPFRAFWNGVNFTDGWHILDVIAWMPLPEPYNPGMVRKQTNADRIRAMTDEDLAINMMCPNENGLAEIDCDKCDNCNCYECLLKWLQSEVEG